MPVRNRHGQKAELRLGKRLGVRSLPASGAMGGAKGDLKNEAWLIESKATIADSISVKRAWLDKISREALEINRDPALCVQFVDALGHPVSGGSWVMIPERVFRDLINEQRIYDDLLEAAEK